LRGINVRAKALTYLRSKNNDKNESNAENRAENRSRFPMGMTERKAKASATARAVVRRRV
jgi:hypothetical protein